MNEWMDDCLTDAQMDGWLTNRMIEWQNKLQHGSTDGWSFASLTK